MKEPVRIRFKQLANGNQSIYLDYYTGDIIRKENYVGGKRQYEFLIDTRRWGSAPHSGFGLGFDRLLLFVTGMTNIRDVQPFPRTPQHADF